MSASTVFHLLPLADYRADEHSPITSPTLDTEGFVHCSPDLDTTRAVADTLYRSTDEPMVVAELDVEALSSPVRWEEPTPEPPRGVSADVRFPHVYGPLDRSAVRGLSYARRDVDGTFLGFERRGDTAERLDLLPHPEGGWYRRTWTSRTGVDLGGDRGSRPTATAIHFLLPAAEASAWHTVGSDEVWMWHSGGPLTLSFGGTATRPDEQPHTVVLGPDLAAGHVPQAVVPAGTWQRADASPDAETLVSCVVSPGFDFADFRTL